MKRQAGFTLVELAVVVFIIGLIASMSFATIKAQIINASIRTTQGNQNTIKDALVAYLGKNRRLPCPDTNFTAPDGIENRGATTGTPTTPADPLQACNAAFGLIPYQTLGLSRSVALDGWDNFFSYQVSNTSPSANLDWTLFSSFHEGNTGAITIKDGSENIVLTAVVAIVISHGKNGLGAYTIKGTQTLMPDSATLKDELQNASPTSPPNVFYKREYTDNATAPGGAFDDVVMALGVNDLLAPLIKDGSMKSPEAQWADQVLKINDALVTFMFKTNASSCAPPTINLLTSSYIATTDPWGGTLTYSSPITKMEQDGTTSPSSATYPYLLTTATAGQTINVPSNITVFGTYQKIINNNCPP
jgi:prepilin-type N-terminal cleavage/methylation domain-containing protein